MSLDVLYEDNHIIAVFKPSGVLVQPDIPGGESLMDEVKEYIKEKHGKTGNVFLGLVHRLDRNVSGIVLFGKTSKGASRLSEQFRERKIRKIYHAVVEGKMDMPEGTLRHMISKDSRSLKAIVGESGASLEVGDEAVLRYELVLSSADYSLLKIELETGKFHQIRAQLSAIGHPIAGDTKYGAKEKLPDGSVALCATEIIFKKATGDEGVSLKIEYPRSWEQFLGSPLPDKTSFL